MRRLMTIAAVSAAFILSQVPASGQFGAVSVNRDSLRALSIQDHAQMMSQLGITSVRPGLDGYATEGPNVPNYDELKANPYPFYPDVLTTFAGKKVTTPEQWYNERRPELVRYFQDQVYGNVPDNVPAIRWKVIKEEKIMMEDIPCIYRELAGVADNSACPFIEVSFQACVTWPENAGKNIPVILEFGMVGNRSFQRPGAPATKSWQQQVVECGWAAGFPGAEGYDRCPVCNSPLRVVHAYEALGAALTVSSNAVSVSVYGSDRPGLASTTKEIVEASVAKYGYDASAISSSINRGIDNGLLMGVDHVEPKDLNVKQGSKAVGVYFTSLPGDRSAPAWDLPIDGNILNILGSIQTAVGIILILLVVFRSRLLKSFQNR